jgi:hypothetical protein
VDPPLSLAGGESGRPGARDQTEVAAPRVIGLDLSLTSTGLSDGSSTWLITSKGTKTATLDDRRGRLMALCEDAVCACIGAALVVVEGPSFGQARQGGQHDRAGLWWLVVADLGERVVEVPPATLKTYATGRGNASKDEVLAAVVRRYPTVDVGNNNEADALVLAAMGARHLGHPIDDLPQTHLRAMTKVAWPTLANEGVPF